MLIEDADLRPSLRSAGPRGAYGAGRPGPRHGHVKAQPLEGRLEFFLPTTTTQAGRL